MTTPVKAEDDIFNDGFALVLSSGYFCDEDYAKKAWDSLQTLEQFKAEWAKYADAFKPWLEEKYLKERRITPMRFHNMLQIPIDDPVCRAVDLRLMYNKWRKEYAMWQKNPRKPSSETFEVWRNKPESCESFTERTRRKPSRLDFCGPIPDWRSE